MLWVKAVSSHSDAPGTNRFEVTMDGGKLVCENDKLMFYKNAEPISTHLVTCKEGFKKPDMEEIAVATDGLNPQHVGVLNAFAANILRGEPLVAAGYEGINGLTLSNAMHLSSWTNSTVAIPFDEDLYLEELNKRRAISRHKDVVEVTMDTTGSY